VRPAEIICFGPSVRLVLSSVWWSPILIVSSASAGPKKNRCPLKPGAGGTARFPRVNLPDHLSLGEPTWLAKVGLAVSERLSFARRRRIHPSCRTLMKRGEPFTLIRAALGFTLLRVVRLQ